MFDRKDKAAPRYQAVLYVATNEVEALHIMQGQGTEHHIEGSCGKVDVFNRQPAILDRGIVGTRSGTREHLFGEVDPHPPPCPLLSPATALPTKPTPHITPA